MVPSLEKQAHVMIECVQNHTVSTMIIDEIGRAAEVKAAGTVRQRGPRLVASAHGDLLSLVRNQELNGLVGGTTSVTLGDAAAKMTGNNSKLQTQRGGKPVFDVVVEMDSARSGVCRIVHDVALAVDQILSGRPMDFEVRSQRLDTIGILST